MTIKTFEFSLENPGPFSVKKSRQLPTERPIMCPPIRNITGVGMPCENGQFSAHDDMFLISVSFLFAKLEFSFANPFKLTALDKLRDLEADFLRADRNWPTDVLFVPHVLDADDRQYINASDWMHVSYHHFEPDAWVRAAERNGAWLILTSGGESEIGISHFTGDAHPATPYVDVTVNVAAVYKYLPDSFGVAMRKDMAIRFGFGSA